jgi:hypothetical protein
MRILITASFLLLAIASADAQIVNGNDNGNGNSGVGSGNGNGNGNGNGSGNTTAVNLNNNRRNAPPVTAPSLAAAGIETCLGSNSVGGSGPGFGVTIAGTVPDRSCNLRLFSRTLYNLGYRNAATQILCNDPDVAAALAIEGVRCNVGFTTEAASRAETRAELPAEAPSRTATTCENYVLFRGCLDKPTPVEVAVSAPPKRKLSTR